MTPESWQSLIVSPQGPSTYSMRCLLLAIAVKMREQGVDEIPLTYDEIAEATAFCKRYISMVVRDAVLLGWLVQKPKRQVGLRRNAVCRYQPAAPKERSATNVKRGTL